MSILNRRILDIYFGPKIPGLWKFSRSAADRSSVDINLNLPRSRYLYDFKFDFNGASPKEIRAFLRRAVRLSGESEHFIRGDAFLQALSAIFGIDEAYDEQRIEVTRQRIIPVLLKEPRIMVKVMELLPAYSAWTASGAQRMMPVAVAIINMFKGRNLFDATAVRELQKASSDFQYLTEKHLCYGNPFGVTPEFLPQLPSLQIPGPKKSGVIKVLDIGTAPKGKGSPNLNILKKAFAACLGGISFEFNGTDIAMPYFKLAEDGSVEYSDFVDPRTGKFREKVVVNGVRYFNALKASYNALSDEFFKGESFDFISICMALHYLRVEGEKDELIPLSSLNMLDPEGKRINDEIKLLIPPSTQKAVDGLLSRLKIGGILLVNPFFPPPKNQPEELAEKFNEQMHRNSNMFFMIRRDSENTFTLFDQFPIPFHIMEDDNSPSKQWCMIQGREKPPETHQRSTSSLNPGIVLIYPNRSQAFYIKVEELFKRADVLAFRYQGWGKGIWGSAYEAIKAIREYKSLVEILGAYLGNVPNEDLLKVKLLEEAKNLITEWR